MTATQLADSTMIVGPSGQTGTFVSTSPVVDTTGGAKFSLDVRVIAISAVSITATVEASNDGMQWYTLATSPTSLSFTSPDADQMADGVWIRY